MLHRMWLANIGIQVVGILVSLSLISWFFYTTLHQTNISDPYPSITYELAKKDANDLPETIVEMGFIIKNFPVFEPTKGDFVIDGVLWLKYDPRETSLESIENVQFEPGTITYRSPAVIQKIDHKIIAQYDVRIELHSSLDYRFFPINDHRILINIINKTVWPNEIFYRVQPENFVVSPQIKIPGWQVIKSDAESGYTAYTLDATNEKMVTKDPKVVLSLEVKKEGYGKIFLILVPLLVMFFVALFSLSIDFGEDNNIILAASLASVSGLLAYRFVIQAMAPAVTYFTLTDYLFIFALMTSFIVLLINLVGIWLHQTVTLFSWLRTATIPLFHLSLLLLLYYLLFVWQR